MGTVASISGGFRFYLVTAIEAAILHPGSSAVGVVYLCRYDVGKELSELQAEKK